MANIPEECQVSHILQHYKERTFQFFLVCLCITDHNDYILINFYCCVELVQYFIYKISISTLLETQLEAVLATPGKIS